MDRYDETEYAGSPVMVIPGRWACHVECPAVLLKERLE
jgi:hypothetical protein